MGSPKKVHLILGHSHFGRLGLKIIGAQKPHARSERSETAGVADQGEVPKTCSPPYVDRTWYCPINTIRIPESVYLRGSYTLNTK